MSTLSERVRQGRPNLVPEYVPLPLDIIGGSIERLDANQERGLETYSALSQLRNKLVAQQIPIPERRAQVEEIVRETDEMLKRFSGSQNFINAAPALTTAAVDLQNKLAPYATDYDKYQKTMESIQKIREKGDSFTEADEYAAVKKSLGDVSRGIKEGKDVRFEPGIIAPRMDVNKAMQDFVRTFNANEGTSIQWSPDGRFIITEDVKGITPERVRESAKRFLLNQPEYMRGLGNDILYQLDQLIPDEASAEAFAKNAVEGLLSKEEAIRSDDTLSIQDRQKQLAEIERLKDEVTKSPRKAIASRLQEQLLDAEVQPYVGSVAFESRKANLQDDPYSLAGFKQTLSDKSEDRKKLRDAAPLLDIGMGTIKSELDFKAVPEQIEVHKGELRALDEQIGRATPAERRGLEARKVVIQSHMNRKQELVQTVAKREGIDMSVVDQINASKPSPPAGMSASDRRAIGKVENSTVEGHIYNTLVRDTMATLSDEGKRYFKSFNTWRNNLTEGERNLDSKMKKALSKYGEEFGETNLRSITLPPAAKVQIKDALATLPPNVGVSYIDPSTGDVVLHQDDLPSNIEEVSGVSPQIIDGKVFLPIRAKIGKESKVLYAVINDTAAMKTLGSHIEQYSGNDPKLGLVSSMLQNPEVVNQISDILPGTSGGVFIGGRDVFSEANLKVEHKITPYGSEYQIVDQSGNPVESGGQVMDDLDASQVYFFTTQLQNLLKGQ